MSHLILSSNTHIASITINNPDKHNCLSRDDLSTFIKLLNDVESNPQYRALIITAAGEKTFCAGASFEHIKDGSLRGDAFSPLAEKIKNLNIPSICLINGNTYGGGVELALACDFRIGLSNSHLQVPIAKLGLSYSEFGLKLYHAVLGLSASKRILLATEKVESEELLRIGFLDYIESDINNAKTKSATLAETLVSLSPLALQTMRRALNNIARQEFQSKEFAREEEICYQSEDKIEGFSALLEKRQANFLGN